MKSRVYNGSRLWLLSFSALLVFTMQSLANEDSSFVKVDREVLSYSEDITVTFHNVGDQDIWVFTTGCGLPDGGYLPNLMIEKRSADKWDVAGSPICIAIATPPLILSPGESETVTFPVSTGLEDIQGNQWFRYVFDIRSNGDSEFTVSKIPKHLRVTKAFEITD